MQSSTSQRFGDLLVYLKILDGNSLLTWLLGNGIGVTRDAPWEIGGISAGLMALVIERGLIVSVLVIYSLARCTRGNLILMVFLLYYSCALDVFWFPVFVLAMSIHYAHSHYMKADHIEVASLGESAHAR